MRGPDRLHTVVWVMLANSTEGMKPATKETRHKRAHPVGVQLYTFPKKSQDSGGL